ncbi:hypothetical protein F2Q69_00029081 [Brassica cretica]|uniref:Uncharacterized protein n=1 Tax=Brassica cretica TaxID=69181 RepID=A0A8S9SB81_BRACR|nr:hypothetical protein F2Q69_00029081 [Brassica cretica]
MSRIVRSGGAILLSGYRSETANETAISMKITIWKPLRNVNSGEEPRSSNRTFDENENLVMKKVQMWENICRTLNQMTKINLMMLNRPPKSGSMR